MFSDVASGYCCLLRRLLYKHVQKPDFVLHLQQFCTVPFVVISGAVLCCVMLLQRHVNLLMRYLIA